MAFSLFRPGNNGNIPNYGDLLAAISAGMPTATSLASAGTTDTLSAQQIASGLFVRSGASSAVASTTDTAANIVAALGSGVFVGQTFLLFYANLNTSTGVVTVAGGTGVTATGTLTIPIAGLRVFLGTVTSITAGSQAVTLQSVFSIGSGVAA